jgi:hypothetical protein
LRRDGIWVDATYYLAGQGRERIEEIVYLTTGDVMSLLGGLPPAPQVAGLQASPEELLAWHAANPRVEPGLTGLLQWATEFRRSSARKT